MKFTTGNYSTLLSRLDATLPDTVTDTLSFPSVSYLSKAATPRSNLISDGWTISDRGVDFPFVSIWKTTVANETITLPLREGFTYNFSVDWGDNSISQITSHDDPKRIHTYTSPGTYTISISGIVQAWHFNNTGDKDKILEITGLGDVGWVNLEGPFYGCTNLTYVVGGNVSSVRDMSNLFRGATNANPNVFTWDFSAIRSNAAIENAFSGINLSTANYSILLNRLDATLGDSFVGTLSFPSLPYNNYSATAARDNLVTNGWSITDGGGVTPFRSRWHANKLDWYHLTPISTDNTITLPLREGFSYNFSIDWGDGTTSDITSHDDPDHIHVYPKHGSYEISITGLVQAWYFNNSGDKDKIYEVNKLGRCWLDKP